MLFRHKVEKALIRIGGARIVGVLWVLEGKTILDSSGWFESLARGFPCDQQGNPLPWLCYPAISLLSQRIRPGFRVFEFGSGYSTLWWASRVEQVISCEHDEAWARIVSAKAPGNVRVISAPLDDGYPLAAAATGLSFHVVIVDGRKRVRCAANSVQCLTQDGVIVWDDSERGWYQDGLSALASQGFKRLDLAGFSPLVGQSKQTSVFYRPDNCLGI